MVCKINRLHTLNILLAGNICYMHSGSIVLAQKSDDLLQVKNFEVRNFI